MNFCNTMHVSIDLQNAFDLTLRRQLTRFPIGLSKRLKKCAHRKLAHFLGQVTQSFKLARRRPVLRMANTRPSN